MGVCESQRSADTNAGEGPPIASGEQAARGMDMEDDLLSIKEIARQLEVPESNVRYWRDRFEDYLPVVGEGRKRRYKKQALDIFQAIRDGYQANQSTEDIARDLARNYPRTMRIAPDEPAQDPAAEIQSVHSPFESVQTLVQSQAKTLEHLASSLNASHSLNPRLKELQHRQEVLHKALASLWKHHKMQRRQLHEARMESAQARAEQQKLEQRLQSLEHVVAEHAEAQREERHKLEKEISQYRYWLKKLVAHLDPERQGNSCS